MDNLIIWILAGVTGVSLYRLWRYHNVIKSREERLEKCYKQGLEQQRIISALGEHSQAAMTENLRLIDENFTLRSELSELQTKLDRIKHVWLQDKCHSMDNCCWYWENVHAFFKYNTHE